MRTAATIARDVGVLARVLPDGTIEFDPHANQPHGTQISPKVEEADESPPPLITGKESDAVKAKAFEALKQRADEWRREQLQGYDPTQVTMQADEEAANAATS